MRQRDPLDPMDLLMRLLKRCGPSEGRAIWVLSSAAGHVAGHHGRGFSSVRTFFADTAQTHEREMRLGYRRMS